MRAVLTLTLNAQLPGASGKEGAESVGELPKKPAPAATKRPPPAEPAEPKPEAQPAPEERPIAAPPTPAAPPKEEIPDNPFGD